MPQGLAHEMLDSIDWEERETSWQRRHSQQDPDLYEESIALYGAIGREAAAAGFSSLATFSELMCRGMDHPFLWQAAEDAAGCELIDIRPLDAVDLANQTGFDADDWYREFTRPSSPAPTA